MLVSPGVALHMILRENCEEAKWQTCHGSTQRDTLLRKFTVRFLMTCKCVWLLASLHDRWHHFFDWVIDWTSAGTFLGIARVSHFYGIILLRFLWLVGPWQWLINRKPNLDHHCVFLRVVSMSSILTARVIRIWSPHNRSRRIVVTSWKETRGEHS